MMSSCEDEAGEQGWQPLAPCRDAKSAQDSVKETSCRRATEAAAGFLKLPLSASFHLIEIREMRLNVET